MFSLDKRMTCDVICLFGGLVSGGALSREDWMSRGIGEG